MREIFDICQSFLNIPITLYGITFSFLQIFFYVIIGFVLIGFIGVILGGDD